MIHELVLDAIFIRFFKIQDLKSYPGLFLLIKYQNFISGIFLFKEVNN